MSLKMMSTVWERAEGVTQTALLVLLALADRADDEGRCWPSVAGLAQRARTSERHVQRILKALEEDGWLARKLRHGTTSMYRITPPGSPDVTPDPQVTPDMEVTPTPTSPRGDTQVTGGVTPRSERGDTQVTRTVKNPQLTVSEPSESARERATRLPDPFPITPDMVQWARSEVPDLDHRAVTEKFVDYWRAIPGARGRKLDWIATWRNWMRREAESATRYRPTKTTTDDKVRDGIALAQRLAGNADRPKQIGA